MIDAHDFDASSSPPPWMLAMTPTFRKEIEGMDRKLLGRIMMALTELSESVITVRGDTLKPLVGQYKNCWRIRLGDYRLIFCPDQALSRLTLLSFGARGGVYED